jgi:hypothetical protein
MLSSFLLVVKYRILQYQFAMVTMSKNRPSKINPVMNRASQIRPMASDILSPWIGKGYLSSL